VNLDDYRTLFMLTVLGFVLIFSVPIFNIFVTVDEDSGKFSEFWLLGSNQMVGDYPFYVNGTEEYTVSLGVGNHMGSSEYYKICVKFSNSTEFLPNPDIGLPSVLPCLVEYQFFISDSGVWEAPISFRFKDMFVQDDVLSVTNIALNGEIIPVSASANWDSEEERYFFDLFFELWRYDVESDNFIFDNRFLTLSLNINV